MRRNVTAKRKQITTFLISKIASKKREKFFSLVGRKIVRFEGRKDFADYDFGEKNLFCYQIESWSESD